MAPIDRKQLAERRMLQLIEDAGLPAPDEVVYGRQQIRLLWEDRRVMVIVDLEDFPETESNDGYAREGIAA